MRIAFRVDASAEIGSGHFMRCLTLADAAASRGAAVRILSRSLPTHLREMVAARGFELADLPGTDDRDEDLRHSHWLGTTQQADAEASVAALEGGGWEWVVVDHYALDARWERRLRDAAAHILAIDDLADRDHDCDVLLDQNAYIDADRRYASRIPSGCQRFLGPRYALLRAEFSETREHAVVRQGPVRRVFVSFGGWDRANHTALALDTLVAQRDPALTADVVVGATHPARAAVEATCRAHGFTCHVQTTTMAALMARADLAIGAAGSETWERCSVGLPAIAIAVAENQRALARDAARQGLVYASDTVPDRDTLRIYLQTLRDSEGLRSSISRRGLAAVDGRGPARVTRAMGLTSVAMRLATPSDSPTLHAWRNHPAIRAVSRTTDPIDRETHERWLTGVLEDGNRDLLFGVQQGRDIGVVRFDVAGVEAEISIYVAPDEPASGVGLDLLAAAERWLTAARPSVRRVRATVLGHNGRSQRFFAAGGYTLESSFYVKQVSH